MKLDIVDVLKLADELGIEYETDSEEGGFYLIDKGGNERRLEIEDIMNIILFEGDE